MPEQPDFDLDEAISADLDGELAAYATELALELPTLRAQMSERSEYPDRLAALDAARQSLRAPVEPLDDVTRARLTHGAPISGSRPADRATSTAPFGRDRAWRILGAAAAVVLVVGTGFALLGRSESSSTTQSKSASTGGARVRSGQLGDLGSLNQKNLDQLIGGSTRPNDRTQSNTSSSPSESFDTAKGADAQPNPADAAQLNPSGTAAESVTAAQIDACRTEYTKVGTVRFSGTGDYKGQPAVVLGVESGRRTIVFVVAATDCSDVLVSVSR